MTELIIGRFRGCGACKLIEENLECKKFFTQVEVAFKEAQMADNHGRLVTVFSKGEIVRGEAVIKDNIVYCVSAKSNIYGEYEDFIDLRNIEIKK